MLVKAIAGYQVVRKIFGSEFMGKNIAIVIGTIERGGAQRVVSVLANHWTSLGNKVILIPLLEKHEGAINPECFGYPLSESVEIFCLGEFENRLLMVPKWILGLRQFFVTHSIDLVLSFFPKNCVLTWLATRGLSCKVVMSERNDPRSDGRGRLTSFLSKVAFSQADYSIFQTEYSRCFYSNVSSNRCDIIPNPCRFEPAKRCPEYLDCQRVITTGRLEPQKNQMQLINAFSEVHRCFPNSCLYIYGEGSLRGQLEQRIDELSLSDCVYLPGNLPNIDIEMTSSSVFVLSSLYEGLPNALIEAQTLGIPCVVTAFPGVEEVILQDENGIIIPVGDEEKLATAIKSIFRSPALQKKLSCNAIKHSSRYEAKEVLKRWDMLLCLC